MDPFLPVINGSGDVIWELEGDLPELTSAGACARRLSRRKHPWHANRRCRAAERHRLGQQLGPQRVLRALGDDHGDADDDGLPDEVPDGYIGNLTADEDDDNDGYSDADESRCGSNPRDSASGEELDRQLRERKHRPGRPELLLGLPVPAAALAPLFLLVGRNRTAVVGLSPRTPRRSPTL